MKKMLSVMCMAACMVALVGCCAVGGKCGGRKACGDTCNAPTPEVSAACKGCGGEKGACASKKPAVCKGCGNAKSACSCKPAE